MKSLFVLSLAALSLGWGALSQAQTQIGVVNFAQLLDQSPQAISALDNLKKEFEPRKKQLESQELVLKKESERLQRDAATMSDAERGRVEREFNESRRELARKTRELMEDFDVRRSEALKSLQSMLVEEVQQYAEENNFDLIVGDGVLYAASGIDVTDVILQRLAKQ